MQDLETTWVNEHGIVRRMQKRHWELWDRKNQIKIQHRDWKNHAIHLKKLPASNFIALQPNTYEIDKQLSAIRKLKLSPLSEHRPLIRLFEMNFHAKWPDVRGSEGDD